MHRGLIALGSGAAALVAVAANAVAPGTIVTFKDWAVGCDNGLECQAASLMSEESTDDSLSIVMNRPAGVNASLNIDLSGFTAQADRYRVVIDGKIVRTGTMKVGSTTVKVVGVDAVKLARFMAKGKALRVVDGGGADLGAVSLSGAAAALRYFDEQQGRAGSRGAVIATGPKMPMAKRAVLPVISAKKITPTNVLPDTSALIALSENSPCAAQRFGSTEDTAYSLGMGPNGPQALVFLNCGSGAYNFSSGVYVGQRNDTAKWTFEPAKFDYAAPVSAEDSNIPVLVNADWNAETQTISSYSKGRGLGDCGSSETYVWDGSMFRLTKATAMTECRGSLDWIPTWRAEVRLVG